MDGYTQRTNKKKESILDAAESLYIEKGPNETNIADIAKRAKVSQVSIYNYYNSKLELFKQVMYRYFNRMIKVVDDILDKDVSFKEKLDLLLEIESTDPLSKSFYSNTDWNLSAFISIIEEFGQKYMLSYTTKIFDLGKADGVIDKDIPIDALTDYIQINMSLFTRQNFVNKSSEYKNGLRKLFYYGFFGRN